MIVSIYKEKKYNCEYESAWNIDQSENKGQL